MCDPNEVTGVKVALDINLANVGVGVHHVQSGRTYLRPIDTLPFRNGHLGLTDLLGLPPGECLGFLVIKVGGAYRVLNSSHLNGSQGSSGSLKMPDSTFNNIVQELYDAGL